METLVQGGGFGLLAAVLWYLGAKVWPSHQAHVASEFKLMREWMDATKDQQNATHTKEIELIMSRIEVLRCPVLAAHDRDDLAPAVKASFEKARANKGNLS